MDFELTVQQREIRSAVADLCSRFPDRYWRDLDATGGYPSEFVSALTDAGWLGALIPQEYGGAGLGISEASIILQAINESGGNAAAAHAQMYTMGTLLRHGTAEQKARLLPGIASGQLRLQAFAVTEPDAGSDTTNIRTTATRSGDTYRVSGQKVFISRAMQSDLMMLLARTSPRAEGSATGEVDRTAGLSVFILDLRRAVQSGGIEIRPIETMLNHHTTEVFFRDLVIPADDLIGQEGLGFRYVLDGWNAERILIASECIGDARWFIKRASAYASERRVFGRPIGANQGVQFPLAQAHAATEAADLMRWKAATLFDRGESCGAEANLAKYLASEASWQAANAALDTHGGYGFAREYDVERKFRETRLYRTAPVNNNLILAYVGQRVLGLPRSY